MPITKSWSKKQIALCQLINNQSLKAQLITNQLQNTTTPKRLKKESIKRREKKKEENSRFALQAAAAAGAETDGRDQCICMAGRYHRSQP